MKADIVNRYFAFALFSISSERSRIILLKSDLGILQS